MPNFMLWIIFYVYLLSQVVALAHLLVAIIRCRNLWLACVLLPLFPMSLLIDRVFFHCPILSCSLDGLLPWIPFAVVYLLVILALEWGWLGLKQR